MRAVLPLLILMLPLLLGACDVDQEDPYDEQNPLNIDLPSLDPNRYHYDGFSDPYYEQWQFRVTGPDGRAYLFIYGVQNPNAYEPNVGAAYVLALSDGGRLAREWSPVKNFKGSIKECHLRIGGNTASTEHLAGHVRSDGQEAQWDLRLEVVEPWTTTMGSLTNIPFLAVNWYVGALRGKATGTITWNGETVRLDEAPFFQDHNWGDVYPTAYVWLQAQKTGDPDWSLALAGAQMDGAGGLFVWRRGDELWEWRTLDLKTRIAVQPDPTAGSIRVELTNRKQRVVLLGEFAEDEPLDFPAPQSDGLTFYGRLAPAGRLKIELYEKQNRQWTLVHEEWAENAAVLLGGAYDLPVE